MPCKFWSVFTHTFYFFNHVSALTMYASVPVLSVGCTTGWNNPL